MTITTEVTWQDLHQSLQSELSDLTDAYDEIAEMATDEYGEDWQDTPLPSNPEQVPGAQQELWTYQQQAEQYDEAAKSIQKRLHLLEQLEAEYGDGAFELKMLSGEETMDIETELRMLSQQEDKPASVVQVRRNTLTVDAATVDAPEGVPREDGTPKPSECPNALTLALWEQVEAFNNAGTTDFQAVGCGTGEDSTPADKSATPTTADH